MRVDPHSRWLFGRWLAALSLLWLVGCATYQDGLRAVELSVVKQDFAAAIRQLDQNQGAPRDRVLHLMNRGALLRMAGNYTESNAMFEQAKRLGAELQAVSLREQTAALSIQEGLKSYVGEDHERILVHVLSALNYLDLGDLDSARVEALQLDVELGKLRSDGYRDDAFARYLSGLIFDAARERDDALIAYRHAYEVYSNPSRNFGVGVPAELKSDLLRLSEQLGFADEHEKFTEAFGKDAEKPLEEGYGEVVVIIQAGLAPRKREHSLLVQDPGSGRLIRISTPHYLPRPTRVFNMKVTSMGDTATAEFGQDIDALARRQLEVDMPGIVVRAIARAVVKTKFSQEIEKKDGLAGLAVNIVGVIAENADTRSWTTLPERIYVARIRLKAGVHDVTVRFDAAGSGVTERTLAGVKVAAGKKTFRSLAWLPAIGLR